MLKASQRDGNWLLTVLLLVGLMVSTLGPAIAAQDFTGTPQPEGPAPPQEPIQPPPTAPETTEPPSPTEEPAAEPDPDPTIEPTDVPAPTDEPGSGDVQMPSGASVSLMSANALSVSPVEPVVTPGESVAYTFTFAGVLTDALGAPVTNGTVVLATWWVYSGWLPHTASVPSGCSFSPSEPQFVSCDTGADGSFDYEVTITANAPTDVGSFAMLAGLVQDDPDTGRQITPYGEYFTIVQSPASNDDYLVIFRPAEPNVVPGEVFSLTVELRGTLTTSGGTPIPNGTVYLETDWIVGNLDTPLTSPGLPSGCEVAYEDGGYLDIACTVGADGRFDYALTLMADIPLDADPFDWQVVRSTLYEDDYTGRVLLPARDYVTMIVVVPEASDAELSISPAEAWVAEGSEVPLTVSMSGSLSSQGAVYLETAWVELSTTLFTSSDLPPQCSVVYTADGYYDIVCQTAADGSFNYTFELTASVPAYDSGNPNANQRLLNATLYANGCCANVIYPETELVMLTIEPVVPDVPDTLSITPSSPVVAPGELVTFTVEISGTVTDEHGTVVPNGEVYIETFWATFGPTWRASNSSLPPECTKGYSGDGNYDVFCASGPDGTFAYSYTITAFAPLAEGEYFIDGALWYDREVIPLQTLVTLTVDRDLLPEPPEADYELTISPADPVVSPGEPVAYSVTFSGTLTDANGDPVPNGTVVLNTLWNFPGWFPQTATVPPGCSSSTVDPSRISCQTDGSGAFSHELGIVTAAPIEIGSYTMWASLTESTPSGRTLVSPVEHRTIVESGDPAEDYLVTIQPAYVVAYPGEEITLTIQLQGTLTDETGTPLPGEQVYFSSYRYGDISLQLTNLVVPNGCSERDLEDGYLEVLCTAGDSGEFDYTIQASLMVPPEAVNDDFVILEAELRYWDGTTFGRELIPYRDYVFLTVHGGPTPQPTGDFTLTIEPQERTVEAGTVVTYTVNIEGTLPDKFFGTVLLETDWTTEDIPTNPENLPSNCFLVSMGADNDVRCMTDSDGNLSVTFDFTLTAPPFAPPVTRFFMRASLSQAYFDGFDWIPLETFVPRDTFVVLNLSAPEPVIDLEKSAIGDTVQPGDALGYSITLTNTGDVAAAGLGFSDVLPVTGSPWTWTENGDPAPASPRCAVTGDPATGQTLTCAGVALPAVAGEFTVSVSSGTDEAACGLYENFIDPGNLVGFTESNPENNGAGIDLACVPVLSIEKVPDIATANRNEPISFTIAVSNTGGADATGISLEDSLPGGLTWTLSTDQPYTFDTCTITNGATLSCGDDVLPVGESRVVTVVAEAYSVCGPLVNEAATASADNADPVSDAGDYTIRCPEVDIAKTAEFDFIPAGDDLVYTITLTNSGDGPADDTGFTDILPDTGHAWTWTENGESEPTSPYCAIIDLGEDGQELSCSGISLAPDGGTFVVEVSSPTSSASCGAQTNQVRLGEPFSDADPDNNTATTEVDCLPDISLVKTAPTTTITTGEHLTYTIVLTNSGTAQTDFAGFSDDLPVTGQAWSWTENGDADPADPRCVIAGDPASGQTLTCSEVSLAPEGGTFAVEVRSITGEGDCTSFANTANPIGFEEEVTTDNTVTVTVDCPTPEPTEEPTEVPTEVPTEEPTEVPTEAPTEVPTEAPTEAPTEVPTEVPTEAPTEVPTEVPTEEPTEMPTEVPTEEPTEAPTEKPTEEATEEPTETPTEQPTQAPTVEPTEAPTTVPTEEPTPPWTTTPGPGVDPPVTEAPATEPVGPAETPVRLEVLPVTGTGRYEAVPTGWGFFLVVVGLILVASAAVTARSRRP